MRNYLKALVGITMLFVLFCVGCEPTGSQQIDTKTVEEKAEVDKVEVTIEEDVQAEADIEAAKAAVKKFEAAAKEADEKAKAETIAKEAEEKAKAEAIAKQAKEKAIAEAAAKAIVQAQTDPNSVAVTVNGNSITEGQIEVKLKPQMVRMSKQMPPMFVQQMKTQFRQKALDGMISEMLLDQKIKEENIVITEEEVLVKLLEMGSQQETPLSLEDIKALIAAQGQSFDQVKEQMKKGMAYEKLLSAQFEDKVTVTEEDAKKFYSENSKMFTKDEKVKASHILIRTASDDPNADPNEVKAKAKATAGFVLKQIQDGADFATLAKEHSTCPSSAKGGDLGFFGKGQMVPPFEKAAYNLEVGQVSEIVETRFGYHIIKTTDRQESKITTFEEAKEDIIFNLGQKKRGELAEEYIESLQAEADIVYPPGKEPKPAEASAPMVR